MVLCRKWWAWQQMEYNYISYGPCSILQKSGSLRGFGRFQHTTVTISGFFKTTTVRVNFQTDGPNWENLEDAAHDYKSLKDEKRVQGLLEPQGWGVLIGDEVKVVAKIQWNSRNNE